MQFEFEENNNGGDSNDDNIDIIPLSHLVNLSPSCQNNSAASILPGPFVVLQGSQGDGMSNTMDSMPSMPLPIMLPPPATSGGSGGNHSSRRNSAIRDRIPDSVLEELDSEVGEESSSDYGDGNEPLPPAAGQEEKNGCVLTRSASFSSSSSGGSGNGNGSSSRVLERVGSRPRSDSDTEGGLHLPLGPASSPIMRNAMNNFMSSPLRNNNNGREDQLLWEEGISAAAEESIMALLPLGGNDGSGISGGSGVTGTTGPFLKRGPEGQPKSGENNKGWKRRNSTDPDSNDNDENTIRSQAPASSSAFALASATAISRKQKDEFQLRRSNYNNKSPEERRAMQTWQQECTRHELSHVEEANENVKLLLQRRKRTREREQRRFELQSGGVQNTNSSDIGISHGRSLSPVGTATSASSSSSSSDSISCQPTTTNVASAATSASINASSSGGGGASNNSKEGVEDDPLNELLHALELSNSHRRWYQKDGRLVVFQSLPRMSSLRGGGGGVVTTRPLTATSASNGASKTTAVKSEFKSVSGVGGSSKEGDVVTLSPGCTVMAEAAYILDSSTLRQIYPPPTRNKTRSNSEDSSSEPLSKPSSSSSEVMISPQLTFLKINSPYTGYILSSIHSYPLLLPGLPTTYTCTTNWLWRVTCQPDGAYIRKGLELVSEHLGTLPYGTVCGVTKKVVNGMGLNRLKIEAHLFVDKKDGGTDDSNHTDAFGMNKYSGYISEFLNPLSGQRGNVVEPLPFPVPALYKVVHSKGCVIRSGVDLSTAQIGFAPCGTVLSIVGRSYSDHPGHNCIERLRLAGGGGWISVTLNKRPPGNAVLVTMVGVDGSFDPNDPAKFHFDSMRTVMEELHANSNSGNNAAGSNIGASSGNRNETSRTYMRRLSSYADLSEIGDDDASLSMPDMNNNDGTTNNSAGGLGISQVHHPPTAVPTLFRSGSAIIGAVGAPPTSTSSNMDAIRESSSDNHHHLNSNMNRCLICLSDERTATIVHGETGHIACCLTCARILKARGDNCPVCRLPIDLVIQQFWA